MKTAWTTLVTLAVASWLTSQPPITLSLSAGSGREPFRTQVRLGETDATLSLQPVSLRTRDFRFEVQSADGVVRFEDAPPPNTWRGEVENVPSSVVTASIVGERMWATIDLPGGRSWTIEPSRVQLAGADTDRHVVREGGALAPIVATCGVVGAGDGPPGQPRRRVALAAAPPVSGAVWFAEIAFDANVEFYRANGSSVPQTMDDIEAVVNAVDAIYTRDVGIGFHLTRIIVRTVEADPYTTANSTNLLEEVRTEWWENRRDDRWDVVHLMTGKELEGPVIGIASQGVVCDNRALSIGLSQSRFPGHSFNQRVWLTAHELGHNWGACHCDETKCNASPSSDCDIMQSNLGNVRHGRFEDFSATTIIN